MSFIPSLSFTNIINVTHATGFASTAALIATGLITSPALHSAEHDHHLHHHESHAHHQAAEHDAHAGHQAGATPIGVMGGHGHAAGEIMLSYRYMHMQMDTLRDGTSETSTDAILMPNGTYMMAPEDMTMTMHMVGAMYAPTDRLTLMAMGHYRINEMTVRRRMPMMSIDETFETESEGLGDTSVSALYRLVDWDNHSLQLQLGLSLPTGSIDETDATPMGANTHLPYPMQLGSGTYDFLPGITLTGFSEQFSWGGQATAVIRLGENDQDYTLGDRYQATAWIAWQANEWFSISTRAAYHHWNDIDGSDRDLAAMAPMMNPNADPDLRGGRRLDLGLGVNVSVPGDGWAAGNSFGLEIMAPAYENLDGPQLGTDLTVVGGWMYAF